MTTSITVDQLQFLTRHNLKVSSVFDAQGMKRKDYMEAMRELNKFVAINVTPCKAMGHTMRTRQGRCIQCNPKAITFNNRYNAHGSVYIAGSLKGKIVKVGFSLNPETRAKRLCGDRYGGRDDWKLLYTVTCDLAGKVEFSTHAELKQFNTPGTYRNYASKPSQCFELFDCDFTVAKTAIEKSLASNGLLASAPTWENTAHLGRYDFSVSKTAQAKQTTQTPATKLTATQKIKTIDKQLASSSVIASNVNSKGKVKCRVAKNKKSGRPAVSNLNSGSNTQKQAEPTVETSMRGRTACSQKSNEETQLFDRLLQVNQVANPISVTESCSRYMAKVKEPAQRLLATSQVKRKRKSKRVRVNKKRTSGSLPGKHTPSRNTETQAEPLATPPKYTRPSEHQYTGVPKPNEAMSLFDDLFVVINDTDTQQIESAPQTSEPKDAIPFHEEIGHSETKPIEKSSVSIWGSRYFRCGLIIIVLMWVRLVLELLSAG
ncbi:hypothetical protein BCT61_05465 [Vibrio breoganii]|nr:hypothetical protein BCT94_05455 [Vibrio breoganii]PMM12471.1 hypothetical protein BCT61_05465 [Vibrio breoganii]